MEIEISSKTKAKVLFDSGKTSAKQIAKQVKVSDRTAYRYLAEFKEGGTDKRKKYKKRNCPKRTSKLQKKVIQKAKDRQKIWSTREIGNACGISHTLARNVMIEKGLKYQSYSKQIKLTDQIKRERLEFARKMKAKESDWGFIIFTDECSFSQQDSKPKRVWTDTPDKEEGTGTHGFKVHCWGAISAMGAFPIQIFEENLKAIDLKKKIERTLPSIKRLYPNGFIFQQDSSGVHRAEIITNFIDEKMPYKIKWPSYSPDISPLENVWSWLKKEVAKDCPKTLRDLKDSIKRHWRRVTSDFLAPYIDSMPQRMKMLIENKGGKITY